MNDAPKSECGQQAQKISQEINQALTKNKKH